MRDSVPDDFDPGSRFKALINPRWCIPDPANDPPQGRAMVLRHLGLGWLAFVFPPVEAARIAEWLTKDKGTPA
jgi:hypothetical protein